MYKFDVLVRREVGILEIVLCGENFPNLLKRCAELSALVRAPSPLHRDIGQLLNAMIVAVIFLKGRNGRY